MSFTRINDVLHAEQCSLDQLAQQYGTPLYVYSKASLEKHYLDMHSAFVFIDHQICFAVKSNSNIAVLNVLAKLGAGFDIVTGGELARVLAAGGEPSKIVFSGLGKSEADIEKALTGMLDPEFKETYLGRIEIKKVFKVSNVGNVAGCVVVDGKVKNDSNIRILRDSVIIYEGKLSTLKRFKDDVKEVVAGQECGLNVDEFNDIKDGDVVEAFDIIEIKRKLKN